VLVAVDVLGQRARPVAAVPLGLGLPARPAELSRNEVPAVPPVVIGETLHAKAVRRLRVQKHPQAPVPGLWFGPGARTRSGPSTSPPKAEATLRALRVMRPSRVSGTG
jgi:hypothetical protein